MDKAMLLRHIQYFLAVANHGSFTRAAASLHVSQPALSQQIKQLEESLRATLFDRTGRSIRLTDAGEAFQLHARRALQEIDAGKRAIHDVRDLSRGSLRIAMTPTFTAYLIGPLVDTFHRLHPGVAINVQEMSQERMEDMLLDDAVDIGIAFDEVRSPDIEVHPFLVETMALVVGRTHPLAKRRKVPLKALNDESMVMLGPSFSTREHIDRYCRQHGIHPGVAMEVDSIGAVVQIVRRGSLSTLLPSAVAREDLVAITLEPSLFERTAALLYRRDGYRSAAVEAFGALAAKASRGFR